MSSFGDCFVVLTPHTNGETVIFGRNSEDAAPQDAAQEINFYDSPSAIEGKSDGGAEPETLEKTLRIILQKPRPGIWGADCGANERNVSIGISWLFQDAEHGSDHLTATDIVRFTLAAATTADEAVIRIGSLVTKYAGDATKINFIVCDPKEVWNVSCAQKFWAAERIAHGFRRFSSSGLSVTSTIDKSNDDLFDSLKTLGLWNGEGDLNFAGIFDAISDVNNNWSGIEPSGNNTYTVTSMFDTLRSAAKTDISRSASVSVLTASGISCFWFTGTPNASESVFKPFVFAPNPKISPLTRVPKGNTITLLHKLHSQRKPAAVDDLKALEAACVQEVNKYLTEHPVVDEELDELMKDCVEAEVKFYR